MDLESANALNARVEALWKQLDTRKQGHLDLNGLKRGLRKIDHPLKNADDLLKDVLKSVDADGNGQISYSEFHSFVKQTELELWQLFKSIDRNSDGRLDKGELQAAFLRAGLVVPNSKLNQFFGEVDSNNDGVISFEEWRDFLLFIPAETPSLKAVLSYYSSTVQMTPEGDVAVNDEIMNGLGNGLNVVKVMPDRMQCETVQGGLHGNKLIIATAKKMWAKDGLRSFYRGLPMGLLGIFPYAAVDLGTFEYLKRMVTSQGTVLHPRTYTGIMDVTRQTIKGEGMRGLFKGLTPNLLKVVPAVSITYVVYEHSKKALNLH
ncbi:putative calcium dependent mitochondrial carrier protein [Neofusicoccum parvum UCRNP2]|uniref:Calcium-binding mitochondrial carrier SAL1 n=2 Tax=Neofusicoccum parvum TaxID=310453 RepID=A0ACB5RRG4_9PEZI|nr:putative calcium dependent mitochondrial carrier protein [Neofusicoccum parvum UCRNP2]GME23118.1 Calcium-binding mitochondrial carrier SAL1 [Neofusicoccum parvum]